MKKEVTKVLSSSTGISYFIVNKTSFNRETFNNTDLKVVGEETTIQAKDGKYSYHMQLNSSQAATLDRMDDLLINSIHTITEHIKPDKDGNISFTLKNLYNTMIFEQTNKRRLSEKQEKELVQRLRKLSNIEVCILIDSKDEKDDNLQAYLTRNKHIAFEYTKLLHLKILVDQRENSRVSYVTLLERPLYFDAMRLSNRYATKKAELLKTPRIKRYTDMAKLIKKQIIEDIERHKSDPKRQHATNNLSKYYKLVGATGEDQRKSVRDSIQAILLDFEDNGYITIPIPRKDLLNGKKSVFAKNKAGTYTSFKFTAIAPNDKSYHLRTKNK